MRLKSIKIAGFKSFVDNTNLAFPTQMTCIVGPNGCGKSNTIDAVRWVLGESSAKNLRGDDMTDVIFNGSEGRHPSSQASVELVFENTDGRINHPLAARNEISIKRIVTKDKKNTYYMNGDKCRRKDVIELFLGTGLGPRSYSIIEQGMISKLIESKPQELRVFLEEAAGISKYKERRKDTTNRIKSTRLNLERLEDVRHEIGKSIEKLKRQSAAAARYKELKTNERRLRSHIATLRYKDATELNEQFTRELGVAQLELEKHITEHSNTENKLNTLKTERDELSHTVDEHQTGLAKSSNEITKAEEQVKQLRSTQARLTNEIQRDEDMLRKDSAEKQFEEQEIKSLQEDIDMYLPELEMAQEEVEETQIILLELQEKADSAATTWASEQKKLASLRSELARLDNEIHFINQKNADLTEREAELKSEIDKLHDIDTTHNIEVLQTKTQNAEDILTSASSSLDNQLTKKNGLNETLDETNTLIASTKEALFTKRSQLSTLKSIQENAGDQDEELKQWLERNHPAAQPIFTQMKVTKGWEKAVENALSLIGNPLYISEAIREVPNFHLSAITSKTTNRATNTLAEKIESEVVPDIFNTIKIGTGTDNQISIDESGVITFGNWLHTGSTSGNNGYFERENEINELIPQIEALSNKLNALLSEESNIKNEIAKLDNDISVLRNDKDMASKSFVQLNSELKFAKQETARVEASLTKLKDTLQSVQHKLSENAKTLSDKSNAVNAKTDTIEPLTKSVDQLEHVKNECKTKTQDSESRAQKAKQTLHNIQLQTQSKKAKLDALEQNLAKNKVRYEQQVESIDMKRCELEETHFPLEDINEKLQILLAEFSQEEAKSTTLKAKLSEVTSTIREIELGATSNRDIENKIKDKIQEIQLNLERVKILAQQHLTSLSELNVELSTVIAEIDTDATTEELEDDLKHVTESVSKLGAVNLAAIEEYEKELQRKEYLDKQNDDLVSALEVLEAAIDKIDRETRAKFKETFEKVNDGLQELFPQVFGGGGAYLELTDSDLLEAGVSIMARPPGKKNSTIHLLSGGEKALTALSLVFSIFKLNPSPFCMLDEVDAPLDDVNVGRFCRLVKSMSDEVQFIYISHNKVAMEMAHALSGVTMNEAGVSRLVSVNIDEIHNFID